jgi:predicted alpha/beta-fold hydrolase
MTVFANLARVAPRLSPRRERWELADGDFLDVDRYAPPSAEAPVVVVCHGLEGSARSSYVRSLLAFCVARGFGAVALNFRGCSGELNRLPRFYHSGETTDFAEVVRRVVAERPGRVVVGAGFSLGGNVIAKYLGETGDGVPPELAGAVVVSSPFELVRSSEVLDGPGFWSFIYRERFLRGLRRKAIAKSRRFPAVFDAAAIRRTRTIRAYDDLVTGPIHGFASAREYYENASCARYLDGLARPLVAIAALDDPMVPPDTLPHELAARSRWLRLEVTPTGGHVAFVSGWPFWPSYWAERRAAELLAGIARDAGATVQGELGEQPMAGAGSLAGER